MVQRHGWQLRSALRVAGVVLAVGAVLFLPRVVAAAGSVTGEVQIGKTKWTYWEVDQNGKLLPKKGAHGKGNRGIAFWNPEDKVGWWYLAADNPHDSKAYNKHQQEFYKAFAEQFAKELPKVKKKGEPPAELTIRAPLGATMKLQGGWKPEQGGTPISGSGK
ncbi:MAG: hypothetical protein KatS3mg102_2719 [Planctomycetota bacterium]|nr:MAG: hypothetical protein KatS3mg102_2719 [Planctomycetota bacterium]